MPYISTDGSARVYGVGDCTCLLPTPRRPRGHLRTTNRQDSTDAPAMVASSISRIKKINFFGPQEVYHRSLWTISELNDTQTAACRIWFRTLVCLLALAHAKTSKTQTIPLSATDGTLILLQSSHAPRSSSVEFCGQGATARVCRAYARQPCRADSSTGGVEGS